MDKRLTTSWARPPFSATLTWPFRQVADKITKKEICPKGSRKKDFIVFKLTWLSSNIATTIVLFSVYNRNPSHLMQNFVYILISKIRKRSRKVLSATYFDTTQLKNWNKWWKWSLREKPFSINLSGQILFRSWTTLVCHSINTLSHLKCHELQCKRSLVGT